MRIREVILWLQDFLFNGLEIRRNLKEIENVIDQVLPSTSLSEEEKLKKLINYVSEYVPYYKKYTQRDFLSFPIINKMIIRENENDFLALGFDTSKAKAVTTSGSTGTPFTVYHDKKKRLRHSADNLFFMKMAGYNIGSPLYYM